jgi:hypothetical protein
LQNEAPLLINGFKNPRFEKTFYTAKLCGTSYPTVEHTKRQILPTFYTHTYRLKLLILIKDKVWSVMEKMKDIDKKLTHSIKKSEKVTAKSNVAEVILLSNKNRSSSKSKRRIINFIDEGDLKGSKINCRHTSLARMPTPQIIDEQFDVNVEGIYYRVFVNYKQNIIGWNEIVSFNYKGMVLLKNPAIHKELIEGLQKNFRNSNTPENLKINSLKYFVKNEINRIIDQREKSKPKRETRGREEDDYLRKSTKWVINHHNHKTESRAATIRRAFALFGSKAQSEKAFEKSIMNRWNSLTKTFNEKKMQGKITSGWKTYANNKLRKPIKVHKQRAKKNIEGKK